MPEGTNFQKAGAEVTLVSGPVALTPPERVQCIKVSTAEQMRDSVISSVQDVNIFIATAAVADYRCAETAQQKIKKHDDTLALTLVKNPDILAEVAALPYAPFTVGFAAETESLQKHALVKLRTKGLDMIAANRVGEAQGFEVGENSLEIFWREGRQSLVLASKDKIARQLIEIVAKQYHEKTVQRSTFNVKKEKSSK